MSTALELCEGTQGYIVPFDGTILNVRILRKAEFGDTEP
jgi:hypothetical protein